MKSLQSVLCALLLIAGAPFARAGEECNPPSYTKTPAPVLLKAYSKRAYPNNSVYRVVGMGNQEYYLNADLDPILPEELAGILQADPAFKGARAVILAWPYSGAGNFARGLQGYVHKPVIGFIGPVWWFPDGSVIGTRPQSGSIKEANASNALQCIYADGKYYQGRQCTTIAAGEIPDQALFGNGAMIQQCADVIRLKALAAKGDGDAAMKLYYYYRYVLEDDHAAGPYLTEAINKNEAQADYIAAVMIHQITPGNHLNYNKMVKLAADAGDKRAKDIVDRVPQK